MRLLTGCDNPQTTPTLRAYLTESDGKVPLFSFVAVIFPPSSFSGWTFIAEYRFRVSLKRGASENDVIEEMINGCIADDSALFIEIIDAETGEWALVKDEKERAAYEKTKFGYAGKITSPRSRKAPAKSPGSPSK